MAKNKLGVQTRSMTDAQRTEGENPNEPEHQQIQVTRDNPEIVRDQPTPNLDQQIQQNAALNLTVGLTRTDANNIEEYVRRHSDIGLDWYVPNLVNNRVRDLIKNRLPISTGRGKMLFNCPQLREFYTTSTFELDLTSGRVYTYLFKPVDIEVSCQQDEFNINLLREHFHKELDPIEHHTEELRRIPLIKKTAVAADTMDIREIEEKIGLYCQLWELYADASCELTAKSKVSQEEAARACKIYGPYIHDVLEQVDAVMTIFAMEKELRSLKGKGHFLIPKITPKGTRIEKPHHVRKTLEAVDKEVVQMLNTIKENERIHEKEKEETRIREQQARATRATQRPEYNFLSF